MALSAVGGGRETTVGGGSDDDRELVPIAALAGLLLLDSPPDSWTSARNWRQNADRTTRAGKRRSGGGLVGIFFVKPICQVNADVDGPTGKVYFLLGTFYRVRQHNDSMTSYDGETNEYNDRNHFWERHITTTYRYVIS